MTAAIVHNRQLQQLMDASTSVANDMLAQQLQMVVDYEMAEIESLYSTVFQDKEGSVSSYLYRDEITTSEDHYAGVELIKELNAIRRASDFLYDFYIWFPTNHSIVSSSMRLEDSLFYRSLFSVNGMEYVDWMKAMSSSSSRVFSSLGEGYYKWGNMNFKGENVHFLSRVLPITTDNNVNPVMVFILKSAAFESLLNSITEDIGSTMLIQSDMQGQIMRFPAEGDIVGTCYRFDSSIPTFHYEIYLDNYIVEEEHQHALHLSLRLTIVVALIGCIAAIILAWRNYRPIRQLGDKVLLSVAPEDKKMRVSNELEQIQDIFSSVLSTNALVEQELKRMRPVYQHHFLYNLLIGTQNYEEDSMKQYGIYQTGGNWMVALLSVHDQGVFDYEGKERQVVHAVIQNVTDELFEGKAKIYYVYAVDGAAYLLLNLYSDFDEEGTVNILEEIHAFFKNRLKMDLCFALSAPVDSLGNIFSAGVQARFAYGTMEMETSVSVCPYSKISHNAQNQISFSMNDELRLMNTIRSGNVEQADNVVRAILRENFGSNALSRDNVRMLVMNLYCVLQRCAQQHGCALGESTESMLKTIRTLTSEEKITDCFSELTVRMTKEIASRKPSKNQVLYQQVRALVAEQCHNPELNVSALAEQIGISSSYLSTLFKEASGENISDYIHKVRIARAKELMEDPEKTLSVIAEECGYLSDISFNRVFKKTEGVPPGVWRNTHFPRK